MGVFDRDGDGKTSLGEASYPLEQMNEYEQAWNGNPHKDDAATCGGVAMGCVLVSVVPIAALALILWIAWLVLG